MDVYRENQNVKGNNMLKVGKTKICKCRLKYRVYKMSFMQDKQPDKRKRWKTNARTGDIQDVYTRTERGICHCRVL